MSIGVEFAFEDHRWWDLKRWRLAHTVWNGVIDSPTAQMYSLFPYKVYAPGSPYDGKWAFEKKQILHGAECKELHHAMLLRFD